MAGTELLAFIVHGNIEEVRKLIKNGADVNEKMFNGNKPLYFATRKGRVEIVRELIKSGADVDAKGIRGTTALHVASRDGNVELVSELIKNGAYVKAKDDDGLTPLENASNHRYVKVVRELIKSGADVNEKTSINETLLHKASRKGHAEVVRELIKNGADVNAKDNGGLTPLDIASQNGHDEVVSELLGTNTKAQVELLRNENERLKEQMKSMKDNTTCQESLSSALSKLQECETEKASVKEQLETLGEEISDISAQMSRVRGESVRDKEDVSRLNLIIHDLEDKIDILNQVSKSGTMENQRLLSEIFILKEEIETLKTFVDNRTDTPEPDTYESTQEEEQIEKGYECVKPFRKSGATRRDRLDSCVPAEGGVFDNIRTALGGRFTNKQKCIEVCYK